LQDQINNVELPSQALLCDCNGLPYRKSGRSAAELYTLGVFDQTFFHHFIVAQP
jgi:hypothetical protein